MRKLMLYLLLLGGLTIALQAQTNRAVMVDVATGLLVDPNFVASNGIATSDDLRNRQPVSGVLSNLANGDASGLLSNVVDSAIRAYLGTRTNVWDAAANTTINGMGLGGTNIVIAGGGGSGNLVPLTITLTNIAAGTSETITQWIDVLRFTLPQAGFLANVTSVTNGGSVVFSDLSTGVITNRFWDFGDGATTQLVEAAMISHTYTNGLSTNTVSLSVVGEFRSSAKVASNLVIVAATPPPPNGGSLVFDGTQNYVEVQSASWPALTNYTVEFWFKFPDYNSPYGIIGTRTVDSNDSGFFVYINLDSRFGSYGGIAFGESQGGQSYVTTTNVCDNAWHHFAAAANGSTITLYVDGIPSGGGTETPISAYTGRTFVGKNGWYPVTTGRMSEIRVSTNDIYTAQFTPSVTLGVTADTLHLWRFNDGAGTNALDSTGNDNGFLQGDPLPTWSTDHP